VNKKGKRKKERPRKSKRTHHFLSERIELEPLLEVIQTPKRQEKKQKGGKKKELPHTLE